MELARAPQAQLQELSTAQRKVLDAIADGAEPADIARKLAKGDKVKAREWRHRIRYWMRENQTFRDHLGLDGRIEAMGMTGMAVHALGRRAQRGRVDAIRLAFEVSGFHNPKVQHNHEHSGTIDINLKMGGRPEPVVDAEVVEE